MTTKELFENLLAGKKMKLGSWCDEHYIVLAENGLLEERFDGTFIYATIHPGYLDWQECKEGILGKEGKEYLSAVLKPFRKRVKHIIKNITFDGSLEYVHVYLDNNHFILPYFKTNTMYKGMELDKKYTLEELGL